MAYELRFPTGGAMDFLYVAGKLNTPGNLRVMSSAINLNTPDIFPNDFYYQKYMGFNSPSTTRVSGANSFSLPFLVFGTWSITDNVSWITLSNSGGSTQGNNSVTVTLSSNTGAQRTGVITLTNGVDTVQHNIVQQIGTVANTLSVSPVTIEHIEGTAGTYTVSVTSNTSWSATKVAGDSWLGSPTPSSGSGNSNIQIFRTANTTSSSRQGRIEITTTIGTPKITRTIFISQYPRV